MATFRTPLVLGSTMSLIGGSTGALVAALLAGPASAAATYRVDTLADGAAVATDCTTPVEGSCSLRDALAAATSGSDTIVFDPSVTGTISLTAGVLSISDDVTIFGGGTIVDAHGASRVIQTTANLTISGLGVMNGDAGPNSGGGILLFQGASLDLSNSFVSGCSGGYGGGVWANNASVTIADSTIESNSATTDGGGLWFYQVDLTITGTTFDSNTTGRHGGALRMLGGVNGNEGFVDISDSTFTGNTATSSFSNGGAIDLYLTDLTISNTTFDSNSADRNGGAIHAKATLPNLAPAHEVTITGSTFSNNDAGLYGGGFAAYHDTTGTTILIANSTFTGNEASGLDAAHSNGGAIDLGENTATLAQDTIVGNVAGGSDSTGAVMMRPATDLTISGTILSGNSGTSGSADLSLYNSESSSVQIDDSLIGEISSALTVNGTGNIVSTTPGVGALADNGGPTKTMALLSTSAAVDAGPTTVATFPGNTFDQRGTGYDRIVGTKVDIGAFEIQAAPPPSSSTTTTTPSSTTTTTPSSTTTDDSVVPAFTG